MYVYMHLHIYIYTYPYVCLCEKLFCGSAVSNIFRLSTACNHKADNVLLSFQRSDWQGAWCENTSLKSSFDDTDPRKIN